MQSSGSTSSQPSQDSMCSSDSFLFSDTDHTEDDTDVFLSEEESRAGRPGPTFYSLDRPSSSRPRSQWDCDGLGEPEGSTRVRGGQEEHCSSNTSFSALVSSSSGVRMEKEQEGGRVAQTEGDHLFAQKCAELQGFVRPLLELLNGLKKGRFDRGLSSFQQSVAMDRIQRIVGVLQKPTIGDPTAPLRSTPPHKHKDQLHIPVKKRRLSWSDIDSPAPLLLHHKRFQQGGQDGGQAGRDEVAAAVSGVERERGEGIPEEDNRAKEGEGEKPEYKVTRWSEPSTTWVHVSPILSPPKFCSSHETVRGGKKGSVTTTAISSPPPARASPATQDSSISSTTPFSDLRRLHPRQCQPVACQSKPVATETEDCEGGATEAHQGWSQCLPTIRKPFNSTEQARTHRPTKT
ncbi:hypothetical protein JZ751_009968 [Albula glossodonta]|uniref:Uncharacterized protein n=1 Tax=Albula glossodonta TaxID=121402 RepID=A0A8T2P248_9TELE|nr:hypothetical protein JZ751_009968 [Albula glossodonta]